MHHRSHDRGVGGVCLQGVCIHGGLHPGGLLTGGSAYRGGGLLQGGGLGRPLQPELGKRAVRILPECFLVENKMALFT